MDNCCFTSIAEPKPGSYLSVRDSPRLLGKTCSAISCLAAAELQRAHVLVNVVTGGHSSSVTSLLVNTVI